jgi:hypothetical protein
MEASSACMHVCTYMCASLCVYICTHTHAHRGFSITQRFPANIGIITEDYCILGCDAVWSVDRNHSLEECFAFILRVQAVDGESRFVHNTGISTTL